MWHDVRCWFSFFLWFGVGGRSFFNFLTSTVGTGATKPLAPSWGVVKEYSLSYQARGFIYIYTYIYIYVHINQITMFESCRNLISN